MDQSEISAKTEDPEEPKTIDDYFGYDIQQTLKEIEYNMEGLSLTIVIEAYDKESSNVLKQTFEYKLDVDEKDKQEEEKKQEDEEEQEEEEKQQEKAFKMTVNTEEKKEEELDVLIIQDEEEPNDEEQCPSDLIKLVARIELRQQQYDNLFNKAMEKLKELQEQYSKEDYKFSLIKRSKRYSPSADILLESPSDSEADSSFYEEDSIRSSDSSTKIKTSLEDSGSEDSDSEDSDSEDSYSEDSDSEDSDSEGDEKSIKYPILLSPDSETLVIGACGTQIERKDFESLQWKDAAGATRELCNVIFGEEILATHSLTGNQSPAFRGRERPIKAQLDSDKTSDITNFICSKFNVTPQLVRATITTKCADAAKKIKRINLKKNSNKM